jgi:hypothetical protein
MIYGTSPVCCVRMQPHDRVRWPRRLISGDHRTSQAASPRISAHESSNLVQFRPARLASYRHQSARSMKVRGRSPFRNSEMPIEIVIVPRRFLLDRIVSSRPTIFLRICSASTVALLSLVFGRMTANSSPPYRAAVSWPLVSVSNLQESIESVVIQRRRPDSGRRRRCGRMRTDRNTIVITLGTRAI